MTSNASSSGSYVQDSDVKDADTATPPTQPQPPPATSITETITRFATLYLTTFFSLDPYTAARRSPHSVPAPSIPDHLRPAGRDYGEGEGIGRRLDPGGPWSRQGRIQNDGRNITIPAGCKTCKYNAMPTIGG
ncbi:hypothetical protein EJ08DRAFT_728952 [Tothia fuscella]|uniref:Uncharacterized protein n=1 Tax=Tothia fuscella TaxID=1048955 RepID=A0A9P4U4V2_9PEZI|nr:hypothetical protein EJ08DRAFT_728952 [Tothia fuscella]